MHVQEQAGAVQMFSLYLRCQHFLSLNWICRHIPVVLYRLDDEAQCWADTVHVLVHDLLHNGCLSCIVQATSTVNFL